jgi:hypothetical protein
MRKLVITMPQMFELRIVARDYNVATGIMKRLLVITML